MIRLYYFVIMIIIMIIIYDCLFVLMTFDVAVVVNPVKLTMHVLRSS